MQDFYRTSVQEAKFISWLTVSNTFLVFFLVYKLWSLYEKLLLYKKMKEPTLTRILTVHMMKINWKKVIKG
jgi:hypothetical protein